MPFTQKFLWKQRTEEESSVNSHHLRGSLVEQDSYLTDNRELTTVNSDY